jgi:hypothetical protein
MTYREIYNSNAIGGQLSAVPMILPPVNRLQINNGDVRVSSSPVSKKVNYFKFPPLTSLTCPRETSSVFWVAISMNRIEFIYIP